MINQVGEKFQLEKLVEAQKLTQQIVQSIASKAFIGMSEADGHHLINSEFKKYGDIKFWHPHKFRINKNTLCAFKETSDPEITLKENDHFFIDVGPIFFDHEGDYGETFIFGENEKAAKLKFIVEDLFIQTRNEFYRSQTSGRQLYDFLNNLALKQDVLLNMKTLGHRVGDFPHHLFYKGKLFDVTENIHPHIWVLEIQISNKEQTMGAFYENII